jgi:hypothetical protein
MVSSVAPTTLTWPDDEGDEPPPVPQPRPPHPVQIPAVAAAEDVLKGKQPVSLTILATACAIHFYGISQYHTISNDELPTLCLARHTEDTCIRRVGEA